MATANNTTARGAFVQNQSLNGVGLAGTDFVAKPVVDQSGWFAGQAGAHATANDIMDLNLAHAGVQGVGKYALDTGKATILKHVEDQTQAQVDDYIASFEAPQNEADAMAYDNMSNSLWKSIGDDPTNVDKKVADISTVEEKHKQTLNKLQRAYKEGAITSLADLEMRVLRTTREAVNRTPGLAQELMQRTQQVMHLSGVRGMVHPADKMAELQQKQMVKAQDNLISYAKTNKIPVDFLNPDYNKLNQDVNDHMLAHHTNEEFKAKIAQGERVEEHEIKEFNRKHFPRIAQATYDNIRKVGERIFNNGSSYEAQKIEFTQLVGAMEMQFDSEISRSGILKDKEGQANHRIAQSSIKNMLKSIDDFTSGADAVKHLENLNAATVAIQKADVMNEMNIVAVDTVAKLGQAGLIAMKEQAPLIDTLSKSLVRKTLNPPMFNSYKVQNGVNDVTTTVGGMILANHPQAVTKSFESIAAIMKTEPDQTTQVMKLTEHFKELGRDTYKGKIKVPDYTFDGGFSETAKIYLDGVGQMFKRSVDDANSWLDMKDEHNRIGWPYVESLVGIAESQEVQPVGKILKNGMLDYDVKNDTPKGHYQSQYRKDVAARVNDVISTYSNIMNVSTKEASDMVLSQFGHMLGIPKEDIPKMQAKDLIMKEEGFKNTAYDDGFGNPTIGFGFTTVGGKPVKYGDTMTRDEALSELQRQLPKYQTFKEKVKVDLSEDQEAALTSFEFNLGSGIWNKGAKGILYAVNSGDFDYAKSLMLQYDKARGKDGKLKSIPGLTNRRNREGEMLKG